jgi:hypothetical protein
MTISRGTKQGLPGVVNTTNWNHRGNSHSKSANLDTVAQTAINKKNFGQLAQIMMNTQHDATIMVVHTAIIEKKIQDPGVVTALNANRRYQEILAQQEEANKKKNKRKKVVTM